MIFHELQRTLPMVTPLGKGSAYFMYSENDEIYWGVFQDETGECWWWENKYIRLQKAITMGRAKESPIVLPDDMDKALEPHKARYKSSQPRTHKFD
jgi:hypothetical protein